jgi:hypothetical protein
VTLSAFRRSLASKEPPTGLPPALAALWWAGKDEWNKAHEIVMNRDDPDCAWVHAYLHSVEGDLGMPVIGIGRQAARPHPMILRRNGQRSLPPCWPIARLNAPERRPRCQIAIARTCPMISGFARSRACGWPAPWRISRGIC